MFKTTQTRLTMTTLERRDVPARMAPVYNIGDELTVLKFGATFESLQTKVGSPELRTAKAEAYGGKESDLIDSKYAPRGGRLERKPPIKDFTIDEKAASRDMDFEDARDTPSDLPMNIVQVD